MTALLLDAGPLIAIDRGDRETADGVGRAAERGLTLRTSAIVIAQAWRDPVDASLVLLAEVGDFILTSDPDDMRRLAAAAGVNVGVVEV